MNKNDLISAIANDTGLSKADSGRALDSVLDNVASSLKGGNKVTLIGFGTFLTSDRAARKGRNPQTGKEINIPAKTAVRFKAGKALSDSVN
ncbi:MAG: DNA-binding protein HU-beta [Sphingobacteriales bacterium]|jgi:DNA-binding protein HU-beta